MTGKKEENHIETLLEDLKTTIQLDLEDKDERPDPRISEVYKGLVRQNNNKAEHNLDATPTAAAMKDLDKTPTAGYVMDILTPPPVPSTHNTHSESQSISSQCSSHLCPSCDSIGYDSDSSIGSQKQATLKSSSTLPFSTIQPMHMQLHQNSNRLARDNATLDAGSSNRTPNAAANLPFSILRRIDKDTASETTSGVSSQDLKIRFATSDSETQTDADPTSGKSVTSLHDIPVQLQEHAHTDAQTIFHLDKYTHLTKRKRSRGIPNVATWFGMSAVEHLIQNSVNVNSWIWTDRIPPSTCNSGGGSATTLLKCTATPRTTAASPAPSVVTTPAPHVTLREADEWESEKSLFEVMSDIGEQILEMSPAASRRGSMLSLASISPAPDKKKGGRRGRLAVPGKGSINKGIEGIKDSIIAKCKSPRGLTSRKKNSLKSQNLMKSQNGDIPKGSLKSKMNGYGALVTTASNLSGSSSSNSKTKEEEEEEKKKKEEVAKAAMKNAHLADLLQQQDNNFDDNNHQEAKKKTKAKHRGGGGRGGGFRNAGGNMMKCAMFDEVVVKSHGDTGEVVSESRGGCTPPKDGQSPWLEGRIPIRNENKSLSR